MVNKSQLLNIYSWFINHIFCGFITFLILESRNGAERVGLEGGIKAAQVLRISSSPRFYTTWFLTTGILQSFLKNAVNRPQCVTVFQL